MSVIISPLLFKILFRRSPNQAPFSFSLFSAYLYSSKKCPVRRVWFLPHFLILLPGNHKRLTTTPLLILVTPLHGILTAKWQSRSLYLVCCLPLSPFNLDSKILSTIPSSIQASKCRRARARYVKAHARSASEAWKQACFSVPHMPRHKAGQKSVAM